MINNSVSGIATYQDVFLAKFYCKNLKDVFTFLRDEKIPILMMNIGDLELNFLFQKKFLDIFLTKWKKFIELDLNVVKMSIYIINKNNNNELLGKVFDIFREYKEKPKLFNVNQKDISFVIDKANLNDKIVRIGNEFKLIEELVLS